MKLRVECPRCHKVLEDGDPSNVSHVLCENCVGPERKKVEEWAEKQDQIEKLRDGFRKAFDLDDEKEKS